MCGVAARTDVCVCVCVCMCVCHTSQCCFLEWTEPLFCGGHWTPALIEWAGGTHPLNPPLPGQQSANPSTVTPPEAVTASDPDVIVICPCGLDLDMGRREAGMLAKQTWW